MSYEGIVSVKGLYTQSIFMVPNIKRKAILCSQACMGVCCTSPYFTGQLCVSANIYGYGLVRKEDGMFMATCNMKAIVLSKQSHLKQLLCQAVFALACCHVYVLLMHMGMYSYTRPDFHSARNGDSACSITSLHARLPIN